jgi:hypothetical protein
MPGAPFQPDFGLSGVVTNSNQFPHFQLLNQEICRLNPLGKIFLKLRRSARK